MRRPILLIVLALSMLVPTGVSASADSGAPVPKPPTGGAPAPSSHTWWSWCCYGSRAPINEGSWRVTGLDPSDPTPNFHYPAGVASDGAGHLYVTDVGGDQVMKFDEDGTFINEWGGPGSSDGEFNGPTGVAIAPNGDVLVVDSKNNRVQVFAPGGSYLSQFGTLGNGNGQFNRPVGIAVDDAGQVYVTDTFNDRIQKFTAAHDYLTQWGSGGAGVGTFARPIGIAIGSNGDVYVTDNGNRLVQRFSPGGTFVEQWSGKIGYGWWARGGFNAPTGITADEFGNLYVADTYHDRIMRFDLDGAFLSQWGSSGSMRGHMRSPTGIAVNDDADVFVADSMNSRIQHWGPCCGLTIGGGYYGRIGSRLPIQGVLGSLRPDCLEGAMVQLLHKGEVLDEQVVKEDGSYRFQIRISKRRTFETRFEGSTLPGGDECPAVTSPRWWVYAITDVSPDNKAAQSSLRNALVAAKTLYTDTDDYSTVDVHSMEAVEPSLDYVTATSESRGPKTISIYTDGDMVYAGAALSRSGKCFYIKDAAAPVGVAGTYYGASSQKDCTGLVASTAARKDRW